MNRLDLMEMIVELQKIYDDESLLPSEILEEVEQVLALDDFIYDGDC